MPKPEEETEMLLEGQTGNALQQVKLSWDRGAEWELKGASNVTSSQVTQYKNKFEGAA